jgi:hypothetical protein
MGRVRACVRAWGKGVWAWPELVPAGARGARPPVPKPWHSFVGASGACPVCCRRRSDVLSPATPGDEEIQAVAAYVYDQASGNKW